MTDARQHFAIIEAASDFVKESLKGAEGGHDWWHTYRVWKLSKNIAQHEVVNQRVVELAAILHDVADSKFHDGDEEIGPRVAGEFLATQDIDAETIHHVVNIISNISYKGGLLVRTFESKELDVVQDADRLDALGAIGIARTFNYGGFKNHEIYNPGIKPVEYGTKEAYKKSTAPSLNHFYEKLLLLTDKMNTDTGKKMAQKRHAFMEQYLEQFYAEWEGEL